MGHMSRIETIKQRTGWTQYDIAARLGVTQSAVSRWEAKGDKLPTRTHRLLDLLEIAMAAERGISRRPSVRK